MADSTDFLDTDFTDNVHPSSSTPSGASTVITVPSTVSLNVFAGLAAVSSAFGLSSVLPAPSLSFISDSFTSLYNIETSSFAAILEREYV